MSKFLTDWVDTELYPTLYSSMDLVLPEFEFKRTPKNWISRSNKKITNEEGSSTGKVYVYEKYPKYLKDFTRGTISVADYVMNRDNIEFIDAVKLLANIVGLEVPDDPNFNSNSFNQYEDSRRILKDTKEYFIYCLDKSKNAKEVREYLATRGYTKKDIEAMELGFIPSQKQLYEYLTEIKKHDIKAVNEAIKLHRDIGTTNKLAIPFNSLGTTRGFIFRATSEKAKQKYIVSTGLSRGESFFNLSSIKGDKELVIVEGYLDALICEARGIDNVVALGGAQITRDQVKTAINRGAKKFTICLDTDEAGKKGIDRAIDLILSEGVDKVFIAELPEIDGEKTDPDSYIKERGEKEFIEAISNPINYYRYKLYETIEKYGRLEDQRLKEGIEGLTDRDKDNLLEEIVTTSTQIKNPLDRDQYNKLFINLEGVKALGITKESLDKTVDRLIDIKQRDEQSKYLNKVVEEVADLQNYGRTEEALDLLDKKLPEVKLKAQSTDFSKLLIPTSEKRIREELAELPESLDTGYKINGEDLLLPSGAITVYAGATGHGKTILLLNSILNVAEKYPNKKFILFTYEESDTSIIQYLLNTYINIHLNKSKTSNRRVIKSYFKTGATNFISLDKVDNNTILDVFHAKREEFFKTYIETGRIIVKYVDYNTDDLVGAIEYLNKEVDNLGGVFIDYFQLLSLPPNKYNTYSRQEQLKTICLLLKDVAVKTGQPLILGAQFNREVTNLQRLHPTNISEAGDIERIVNTLIGLWNMHKSPLLNAVTKPEINEINMKLDARGEYDRTNRDLMYLEVLKSRELPTGIYDFLNFDGNTGKVSNRDNTDKQFKPVTMDSSPF